MGYGRPAGSGYRVEQPGPARPVGITVIACFQLLKSGALLVAAALLRFRPELVEDSNSVLYPVLYVATRGRFNALNTALQGGNALPGLLLLLGFYLGAIGIGLWHLNPWSRRTTIFTTGMTLLAYVGSQVAVSTQGGSSAAAPDLTNFYLLLFLDTAVFLYLMRGNTAECFVAAA